MRAELPIGAFLASILVLIPIPWHWRARSIPTLAMIPWLFIDCFSLGVNSIIWAGNVLEVVPVWCDIITKFNIGSTVALPAACLCLTIRLESISACRQVHTSRISKRRWMLFELFMCFGLPCIYMALHYVVQGHRFDIVEDMGCRFTYYVSIPAVFIMFIPPLLLSTTTLVFGGMALVHFFHRRASFAATLRSSQSALTTARYVRLMLMSIVLMLWTLGASVLQIWFSARGGLRPWISWANVHSNWTAVGFYPNAYISQSDYVWTEVIWWAKPLSAMLFAAFFMFGEDAIKEYKACWTWIRVHVLRRPSVPLTKSSKSKRGWVKTTDSTPSAYSPSKNKSFASLQSLPTDAKSTRFSASPIARPILSASALRAFARDDRDSFYAPSEDIALSPLSVAPSESIGLPPDYVSDGASHHRRVSLKSYTDTPPHSPSMA